MSNGKEEEIRDQNLAFDQGIELSAEQIPSRLDQDCSSRES
jgi:hypothetical protein